MDIDPLRTEQPGECGTDAVQHGVTAREHVNITKTIEHGGQRGQQRRGPHPAFGHQGFFGQQLQLAQGTENY
ncbi:Uncharacterised protein [Mycobacteroides abscessus]|nr:Uncharacterised protein [Mycobacteroides abscessus]